MLTISPVYQELAAEWLKPTLDVLREWVEHDKEYRRSIFFSAFDCIGKIAATRDAHVHDTTDFARNPSPTSDLSSSSSEDKDEEFSRQIFPPLFNAILLHDAYSGIASGGYTYRIRVYVADSRFLFQANS
jgi:hypothetical protein